MQHITLNTTRPTLITGANGFIAGHLAERLVREGVPVRGMVRRPAAADWLAAHGVEVVRGELLDAGSVAAAAEGCGAVVHVAAWTGGVDLSPEAGYRTNVAGTANVLAAARGAGVDRVVYLSSVAVYGLNRARQIDESMPTPQVGQAYPDSKIAAEGLVRECGLPYVIVRPASTYGPRGAAWTLGPIDKIKAGQLLLLGQDAGLVTPGYIDNVVDGLWLTLNHSAALNETFNLCDDQAVTFREFYLAYARMLGIDRLPTVPAWSARLARKGPANLLRRLLGRPSVGPWSLHFRLNPSQFSVKKAQRVLGYAPKIDFAEGMRRTEIWLRGGGFSPALKPGALIRLLRADLSAILKLGIGDWGSGLHADLFRNIGLPVELR